ncbi:MAG: hypothetical protein ACTSRW_02745 [Candidatus Helarchaeota archaeon]
MSEEQFQRLLKSMSGARLKQLIKDYNDECIREGRKEDKMKGYSKLKKDELVDFISSFLSEDEKEKLYEKLAPEFAKDLIQAAISLMLGEDKREKVIKTKKIEPKGYQIEIKGFQWDNEASIQVEDEAIESECTCRIGENEGICRHQIVLFLILHEKGEIKLDQFPFKVKESWLDKLKKDSQKILSQLRPEEDADIIFDDNYKIFINGDFVTLQWEGEYAGKTTKDIAQEKDDLETWIAKKVTDLILKPLKRRGRPRFFIRDGFDSISKIMDREKLVTKILKKFQAVDADLPGDPGTLEQYLRSQLKK